MATLLMPYHNEGSEFRDLPVGSVFGMPNRWQPVNGGKLLPYRKLDSATAEVVTGMVAPDVSPYLPYLGTVNVRRMQKVARLEMN